MIFKRGRKKESCVGKTSFNVLSMEKIAAKKNKTKRISFYDFFFFQITV